MWTFVRIRSCRPNAIGAGKQCKPPSASHGEISALVGDIGVSVLESGSIIAVRNWMEPVQICDVDEPLKWSCVAFSVKRLRRFFYCRIKVRSMPGW